MICKFVIIGRTSIQRFSHSPGIFSVLHPGYPGHKQPDKGDLWAFSSARWPETHSGVPWKRHDLTFKKSWKPFRSVLLLCFLKKTFQITDRSWRSHWWFSTELSMWFVASALVVSSTVVIIQTQRQWMMFASCQKWWVCNSLRQTPPHYTPLGQTCHAIHNYYKDWEKTLN